MAIFNLRFVVLKSLAKGSKSGYDLIKGIEEDIGWKPSPGSMYPLLEQLLKEKTIAVKKERCDYSCKRKKIIYALTKKGKDELRMVDKKREEVIDHLQKDINIVEKVIGLKGKTKGIHLFLNILKKGKIPFGALTEDFIELRDIVFRIIKEDKIKKNEEKIRRIIRNTINELNKI